MHCILKCKIIFIGQIGYNYVHIDVKDKGIVVEEIQKQEALDIIADNNLSLVEQNEYGKVFSVPEFKDYINSNAKLKETLISLTEKLDNES